MLHCNGRKHSARFSIVQSIIMYYFIEKIFFQGGHHGCNCPKLTLKKRIHFPRTTFPSASSCFRPGRPRWISKSPVKQPMSAKTLFTGGSLAFWRGL